MKTFRAFIGEARNSALNWNVLPSARKGPPDTEVVYHKDIGLPTSFDRPDGIELDYGEHARDRAMEKGITLPDALPEVYDIIEVTMRKYRVVKWVVRFQVSKDDDIVMPILADGTVKTAWLNSHTDKHTTLNKANYSVPNF
jgi:hypothetical protein